MYSTDLLHPRPDFLVISPPKTGSTWLAANLRCHPQLFVPAVKEVKYFSSLARWLDFNWYCDHFRPAEGRRAGEASPSYASLPLADIRLVRQLLPDVKLVFLMRDPVARAWSHAKHNRRYREANFADEAGDVTGEQWRANFGHDWPLVSGDYLGQLRRWSSVFPREQLFLGFYEDIATRPADLLRDVFAFLGVESGVDFSSFPVEERILVGPSGDLSADSRVALRELLQARTEELAQFLCDRFDLAVPAEWRTTLEPPVARPAETPRAFRFENDDEYLSGVVRLEETFASARRVVVSNYRGHDLVFSRGTLYAVLCGTDAATPLDGQGWLTASSVTELKERITDSALAGADRRVRAVEDDLRSAREEAARVATQLAQAVAALHKPTPARRVLRALRNSARHVGLLPPVRG